MTNDRFPPKAAIKLNFPKRSANDPKQTFEELRRAISVRLIRDKIMPLNQIANIAEIIAAALVIVSLLYVGYQIRETRIAVRAATAQARTDLGVQLIMSRYTSDIAELLTRSLEQPDSLSLADRFKLKSFFTAHVRHCQNLYYQKEQGLLDEYFAHGIARSTAYWIRNYPWAKDEWAEAQKVVPPQFKNFIDAELAEHPDEYKA